MEKKKKDYTCKWCRKTLGSKESKSRHQKTCSDNKSEESNPGYICEKCGYSTLRKDSYNRHAEKCKGKKEKFVCHICSNEFKRKEHLQNHLLTHEKVPHKCGACGRTFKREDFYNQHIQRACPNLKDDAVYADSDENPFPFDEAFYGISRESYSMGWNESPTSSTVPDFEIETVEVNEALVNQNIDPEWNTPSQVVPQAADIVESQNQVLPPETNIVQEVPDVANIESTESPPVYKKYSKRKLLLTPERNSTPEQQAKSSTRERQRKYKVVSSIVKAVEKEIADLPEDEQLDLLKLSLKRMKKLDKICTKPSKRGRKLIPFETHKAVWDFYHSQSQPSTLTSRPAKLRVSSKPKIQLNLEFVDSTNIIKQRNAFFYESNWFIIQTTKFQLFQKYLEANPDKTVSWGTFLALQPFYIRPVTKKDLEMCVCKKHLHARWAIKALVENATKQNMHLDNIVDYDSFFKYLTSCCGEGEFGYIDWNCTPSKSNVCNDIAEKWTTLKDSLLENDDKVTVSELRYFEKQEVFTKKGVPVKRLKAVSTQATLTDIINFIEPFLFKFIHHRNQLRHYRKTIHKFRQQFNAVSIDVDLSENLSVPVEKEPQSMHWSHQQITIHSGILKVNGEKYYHPYLSNTRVHDQELIGVALNKMLSTVEDTHECILIESDNANEYKSCQHFYLMQNLSNEQEKKIIRAYGIAEHGKGEVDHVGGIAKTTLRRAVAQTYFFENAGEMVEYLQNKFIDKVSPIYVVREIEEEELAVARKESLRHTYGTIDGTSTFQVVIFTPHSSTIKASPRICMCQACALDFGSCSLFAEYEIPVTHLKETALRSTQNVDAPVESSSVVSEFLLPGSVCGIAPCTTAREPVWFVKVVGEVVSDEEVVDDYQHVVPPGVSCLEGRYLEQHGENRSNLVFKMNKRKVYFYKESVIYPFVNYHTIKDGTIIHIPKTDYVDILFYVDHFGFSQI